MYEQHGDSIQKENYSEDNKQQQWKSVQHFPEFRLKKELP